MATSNEYVKQFGSVPFSERPFGDADNIALCGVFYMQLEKVMSDSFDDEPRPFAEVCNELFELHGRKHKPVGLILKKGISELLMKMASTERFSSMKVLAFKHIYNECPAVQFDAATFILPDGVNVIVFRGTDDTIAGWREDLDIYTRKYIPSYKYCLEYLEEATKRLEGDFIICGHSKGGHVALYAALNCSSEIADRIKLLYNNDGPGFHDLRPYATPAYRELLPRYRHFIPQSSFIGMLLAHDDDYSVVKSTRLTGPFQHDLSTWQIADGEPVFTKLSLLGRFNDRGIANVMLRISDEQSEAINAVATAILGSSGTKDLTTLMKNAEKSFKGISTAWKSLDSDLRQQFLSIFNGALALIGSAAREVRKEAVSQMKSAARLKHELKKKIVSQVDSKGFSTSTAS